MEQNLAPYACDDCRARKVSCTRDPSGCLRCHSQGVECVYSRSGIIRRNRRRKAFSTTPGPSSQALGARASNVPLHRRPHHNANVSHTAHERLQMLAGPNRDHPSLKSLASLFEAYQSIWQDSSGLEALADGINLGNDMEVETAQLVPKFVEALQGEHLPIQPPSEVLTSLRGNSPQDIKDRAWLVMFHTISLRDSLENTSLRGRGMLYNALNDAKFLLEPRITTIQALILMVTYLDDILSLSTCWMLVNKACAMLQAIGISHPRRETATQEQRMLLFWRLNVLDKTLSLALYRPPSLHARAMCPFLELPELNQLIIHPSGGEPYPRLFAAHFTQQKFNLSLIMGEVWDCVYDGRLDPDKETYLVVKGKLEAWYRQANEVLKATAIAEKPLLPPHTRGSIDIGLQGIRFQHDWLLALLSRPYRQLEHQNTRSPQQLLTTLQSITLGTTAFSVPTYQLLHAPFTAFLTLFGEILSHRHESSITKEELFVSMKHLPAFLERMHGRHPQVEELKGIATQFVDHLGTIVRGSEEPGQNAGAPTHLDGVTMDQDTEFPLDELFAAWTDEGFFDGLLFG